MQLTCCHHMSSSSAGCVHTGPQLPWISPWRPQILRDGCDGLSTALGLGTEMSVKGECSWGPLPTYGGSIALWYISEPSQTSNAYSSDGPGNKASKEVGDTEAALISGFRMELGLKPPMIAGTWHPQLQLWFPGPCLQEGWRVGLASRT